MVFLGALFLTSVVFTINKKRSNAHSEQVVQLLDKSKENLKKAEELIDLNNARAREYVRSSQESLTEAKALAGEPSSDVTDLEERITKLLDQVNKVSRIDSPEVLYDLKAQREEVNPRNLVGIAESLFVSDQSEGIIYRLKGVNQSDVPQVERMSSGDLKGVLALLPGNSRLFAVTPQGVVIAVLGEEKFSKVD